MRKRFEQQTNLSLVPIKDVFIPLNYRDGLPSVLLALQYVFITPTLSEKIFSLLETKITSGKKNTGRPGMDLWYILVLGVVRHVCDIDWDALHMVANFNALVRMVLGVHPTGFLDYKDTTTFCYQTIRDNVNHLDEDLLRKINLLLVNAGHGLVQKEKDPPLYLKTDSFVVERNVHFPSDMGLNWDSLRKSLDMVQKLASECGLIGWRKVNDIKRTFKKLQRSTALAVRNCKDDKKKVQAVKGYLESAQKIIDRIQDVIDGVDSTKESLNKKAKKAFEELKKYHAYMVKFSDQIRRRLIDGEIIPHIEKIFSIFEEDVEWITKGKVNKPVELGHLGLITTDQHQFIVDYHTMYKEKDAPQVPDLCKRLKTNFGETRIKGISFDKGFFSKDNAKELAKAGFTESTLPKRGRHTKEDKEREGTAEYKKRRNAHSAIESNINMLEHHGLSKCMDKGKEGYKRYVGLSVMAYNLHRIGNILKAKELKKQQKAQRKRAA